MSRFLPEVLNALLAEGRFSADDLAEMAGCSASMIYKVRSEDADLTATKAAALARALCAQGETRVALCFLTPDLHICTREAATANGQIEDDIADMNDATSLVRKAFKSGEKAAFDEAAAEIRRVAENIEAEGRRL